MSSGSIPAIQTPMHTCVSRSHVLPPFLDILFVCAYPPPGSVEQREQRFEVHRVQILSFQNTNLYCTTCACCCV